MLAMPMPEKKRVFQAKRASRPRGQSEQGEGWTYPNVKLDWANDRYHLYSPDHFGEVDVVGNSCCIVQTQTTTSSRRRETVQQRTQRKHMWYTHGNKTTKHGDIIGQLTWWRHLYHRRANKHRRYKGLDQALVWKILLVGRWASVQWSIGRFDFWTSAYEKQD